MSGKKVVRVAGGQGFWGDWLEAPRRQVEGGPVDYLMLDYLAEVTMSIMAAQKMRNPQLGYATDFVSVVMAPLGSASTETSNGGTMAFFAAFSMSMARWNSRPPMKMPVRFTPSPAVAA